MADAIPVSEIGRLEPEVFRLSPFLVKVIVPFSTGTVDEAVRQVQALIEDAVSSAVDAALEPIRTALGGKQPLNADLTAIAALGTTEFGRELLTLASKGAARDALGLAAVSASGSITDLTLTNLPSSLPAAPGVLWNNGGLLSIS